MFKHNLTQEVVYNSLLKKERQAAHERIALVMEQLFPDGYVRGAVKIAGLSMR